MMLNLLVKATTSYLKEAIPQNENACFNVAYFDASDNPFSLTSSYQGFFVAYKVNNGETQYIKKAQKKNALYQNTKIQVNLDNSSNTDFIFISFIVSNNNQEPIDFSLGIYADLQLGIVNSNISPLDFRQGFTVKSNTETIHVLTNGINTSTSSDAFWYGKNDNSNRRNYESYPYWNNLTNPGEMTGDVEISLSWQNRNIKAGETVVLGFIIGKGATIKTPPKITLITDLQERYDPETKVSISFTIYDNDIDDTVTVFYYNNYTDKSKKISFNTSESSRQKTAQINVTMKNNPFNFKLWAVDSSNITSNLIEKTIIATKLPTVEIDENLQSYKKGDNITLKGKVWDETFVNFHYKFDSDERYTTFPEKKTTNNEETDFSLSIQIPDTLQGKDHKISIYVTDEYGFKSEGEIEKTFTLIEETSELPPPNNENNEQPSHSNSSELSPPINENNEQPSHSNSSELSPPNNENNPTEQPSHSNSSESINNNPRNGSGSAGSDPIKSTSVDPSNSKWIIPVAVSCAVLLIIIIIVGAIYVVYKKNKEDRKSDQSFDDMQETITVLTNNNTSITLDNPLFTTNTSNEDEDMFKEDFEEEKAEKILYIIHNDADDL